MNVPSADPIFFRERFMLALAPLRAYHRFTLHGAEHLPKSGRGLVLCHHSAATYDMFLFLAEAYRRTGRLVRSLGDHFWFRFRPVGRAFERFGAVDTSPEAARALLDRGELVALAPGGMWEALRPSTQRNQLRWDGRRGFARLAIESQSPILLFTCPGADRIYTLRESRLTDWLYQRYKIPLPLARGWGPTLLPRPVRLDAYLSPPIAPPAGAEVERFRDEIVSRMRAFMAEVSEEIDR